MSDDDRLQEAREAFARHDWATARDRFRAVADLSTDDLADLGTACWWLGLPDENVAVNAEVHRRRLEEGRKGPAGLVALEIGYCEILRGNGDVGAAWLARARRTFSEVPEAVEAGYLMSVDAEIAIAEGDVERASALADDLIAAGDRSSDPTLLAQGLFLRGLLAVYAGRAEEATGWLDEAMLPVREGRVVAEWSGNLYCRMMQLCHELGDLPRAKTWTAMTEEWCRGYLPAAVFSGICRVHRVQILQVEGEWDRAASEASRAAEELADLDLLPAGEAHYRLGEIHRLRGDLDLAEAAYRQAHECGRDPLPGLALLHLGRGRTLVAASILDAALDAERAPLRRAPLLAARAEVGLGENDVSAVGRYVDELDSTARTFNSPGWLAEAAHWRGALLAAEGEHARAISPLRAARAAWQRIGAPYDVARVRLKLADAADALGDHDSAERERSEAASTLARLGARLDLTRLEARRHGRRHTGALSPREVEVVAAIADGDTNRDAASRLHISERTVARHLANVYSKTGVSSRTGAVAWARERGLV